MRRFIIELDDATDVDSDDTAAEILAAVEDLIADLKDFRVVSSVREMRPLVTEQGATFMPWVSADGYNTGFEVTAPGLPDRIVYFNPSSGTDQVDSTAANSTNTFIYVGETGDPSLDPTVGFHVMIWDDEEDFIADAA